MPVLSYLAAGALMTAEAVALGEIEVGFLGPIDAPPGVGCGFCGTDASGPGLTGRILSVVPFCMTLAEAAVEGWAALWLAAVPWAATKANAMAR